MIIFIQQLTIQLIQNVKNINIQEKYLLIYLK